MAQYTPHYGLHQWEPEDSFLREDFNQDLARIDTALAEKAEQMQLRAGKCDMLFKMLDSFNQNALHVTVTWHLMHNEQSGRAPAG